MKRFAVILALIFLSFAFWISLPLALADKMTVSYDAVLSGFDYPFETKFFEFTSQKQSLKMAYMDIAPSAGTTKPNGKTVLLLHGKNFGSFYWEPTIRALAAKGYRVIAPDQIGFGKSSKPQAYQFTFQGLAQSTRQLLTHLKIEKVSVVGHSMGGMLATRFALMYPDVAQKLVLVNPLGLEDWKLKVPYQDLDKVYGDELKTSAESIREYQKKAYYAGEWKPEYEQLIQAQAGWTRHADFPQVAWNAAQTFEMIYTQPVIYEFAQIKMPTLLVIGLRDRTAPGRQGAPKAVADSLGDYPKLGKAAAKAIPGAKLVEMKGVGHVPQIEKFDEYAAALFRFL